MLINEFDFVRGRRSRAAVPRQLPRGPAERRAGGELPVLLRRAVEHRHRRRASTSTTDGVTTPGSPARQRRLRLRRVPGPVRDGRLLEVPDRPRAGAHVPALPLEGHAGRAAAVADAGSLLAGGARRPAAVVEEPLGRADPDRPQDRALPRRATRRRRCSTGRRTATAGATPTRSGFWADYVTPGRGGYIYDDEGRRGGLKPRRAVRDRRRPELRPARRRQHPRRGDRSRSSCSTTRGSTTATRRRARAPRGDAAPGRRERDAPQRPAVRHGGLHRHRAGQPARGLRAAEPEDPRSTDSAVFWPLQRGPAVPADRRVRLRRLGRRSAASRRPTTGWSGSTSTSRAAGTRAGTRTPTTDRPAAGGGVTRRRPPRRRRPRPRRP